MAQTISSHLALSLQLCPVVHSFGRFVVQVHSFSNEVDLILSQCKRIIPFLSASCGEAATGPDTHSSFSLSPSASLHSQSDREHSIAQKLNSLAKRDIVYIYELSQVGSFFVYWICVHIFHMIQYDFLLLFSFIHSCIRLLIADTNIKYTNIFSLSIWFL